MTVSQIWALAITVTSNQMGSPVPLSLFAAFTLVLMLWLLNRLRLRFYTRIVPSGTVAQPVKPKLVISSPQPRVTPAKPPSPTKPKPKQPFHAFLVLDVEGTCQLGSDFDYPNEIIVSSIGIVAAIMRFNHLYSGIPRRPAKLR